MLNYIVMTAIIIFTVLNAFGSVYLKKGSRHFSFNLLKQYKNKDLLIGISLFAGCSLGYILLLKYSSLSTIYPLTSLTFVWTAFLSVRMLNEKMNMMKWAGIFLIIAGTFLLAYCA